MYARVVFVIKAPGIKLESRGTYIVVSLYSYARLRKVIQKMAGSFVLF